MTTKIRLLLNRDGHMAGLTVFTYQFFLHCNHSNFEYEFCTQA